MPNTSNCFTCIAYLVFSITHEIGMTIYPYITGESKIPERLTLSPKLTQVVSAEWGLSVQFMPGTSLNELYNYAMENIPLLLQFALYAV